MDLIEDYIQNRLSGRTRKTYKTYLKRYLRTTKQTSEKLIQKDVKSIGNELIIFIKGEQEKGTPPKTIYNIKATVTGFLLYNNMELQPKDKDQIKYLLKNTESITFKEILTKKQLKEILQHADNKTKAIFLIASSSGMRISEILSLTKEHIDSNHNPTKIIISGKYTKTKRSRIAFISNEATETLQEWLKPEERNQYLINAVKKYNNKNRNKSIDDNRIFPMSYENTRILWKKLLIKAGYHQKDPDTGILIYGIHTLRAYFKSRMLAKEINPKIIDILAGHKTNRREYDKLTTDELAEKYLKGMPELEIYTQTPDLTETNEKIKKLEDKISKQNGVITALANAKEPLYPADILDPVINMVIKGLLNSTSKEEFKQGINKFKQGYQETEKYKQLIKELKQEYLKPKQKAHK